MSFLVSLICTILFCLIKTTVCPIYPVLKIITAPPNPLIIFTIIVHMWLSSPTMKAWVIKHVIPGHTIWCKRVIHIILRCIIRTQTEFTLHISSFCPLFHGRSSSRWLLTRWYRRIISLHAIHYWLASIVIYISILVTFWMENVTLLLIFSIYCLR